MAIGHTSRDQVTIVFSNTKPQGISLRVKIQELFHQGYYLLNEDGERSTHPRIAGMRAKFHGKQPIGHENVSIFLFNAICLHNPLSQLASIRAA